jgi:hypothetical protein
MIMKNIGSFCFIFFISIAGSFGPIDSSVYINKCYFKKKKICFNYSDSTDRLIPLRKIDGKRYFINGLGEKIFIDVDEVSISDLNIDSLFKTEITYDLILGENSMPLVHLIYIVDESGNTIQKGFSKGTSSEKIQKDAYELMKSTVMHFKPAKVNNRPVGSVKMYTIDFSRK